MLACSSMGITSIQDRTAEFRTVLAQAQKNLSSKKVGAQRQSLLTDAQRRAANGSPNGNAKGPRRAARSEFARKAAEVGRGITGTMEKLERLAQRTCSPYGSLHIKGRHRQFQRLIKRYLAVAKRKTLFDDRPNEINELTFVIKQDLASLNSQISSLQSITKTQQSHASHGTAAEQEGEHNKNVRLL